MSSPQGPLEGHVYYEVHRDGFWDKVGSILAGAGHVVKEALPYVAQAASMYASSLGNSSSAARYNASPSWDLPNQSSYRSQPIPMPEPIQPRPLPNYQSEPIVRNALARLGQQQALIQPPTPDWTEMQARSSRILNEIASSHGLPSYEQFHRDNGAAYNIQPHSSSLGIERLNQSSQSNGYIEEDYGQIQRNLSHAQKPVSYSQLHNTQQKSTVDFAGHIGRQALDFLILDDMRTLQDPKAPDWAKGLALASFFPVGKVLKGGKLLTKVVGKSDDVLRHLANKGLSLQQIKKYERFVKKTAGHFEVRVYELPKGGKMFETVRPGRVPGSYAHYEKYLDQAGETVIFGKRSFDPQKRFIHWHEKKPFAELELLIEEKYLIRIKQLIEYNKL